MLFGETAILGPAVPCLFGQRSSFVPQAVQGRTAINMSWMRCGERLRGGSDFGIDDDDARLARLRRERFGDEYGRATEHESSGIYSSGGSATDSLVVAKDNDDEERELMEKARRGLMREKKRSGTGKAKNKKRDFDADKLLSEVDLGDSQPDNNEPLPQAATDERTYEAKVAALEQDTMQMAGDGDVSPEGSQAEESRGDGVLQQRLPQPFFWEKKRGKKGEPMSRHPLLSAKVRERGEAFSLSEPREADGDSDEWLLSSWLVKEEEERGADAAARAALCQQRANYPPHKVLESNPQPT